MSMLSVDKLHKTYRLGRVDVPVLRGVSLDVRAGEWLAVLGASGSGKSTLLHLLGGLDNPTEGSVMLRGKELTKLDSTAQGKLRNEALGFVYQFHHLLPEFSALENVAMPLLVRREPKQVAEDRARCRASCTGMRRISSGIATFSSAVNSGSR